MGVAVWLHQCSLQSPSFLSFFEINSYAACASSLCSGKHTMTLPLFVQRWTSSRQGSRGVLLRQSNSAAANLPA